MTLIMRNRMIQSFNEEPGVTCFLMSLKAGGVALNLTVASHVMLMDPWWNPAVEQQAQVCPWLCLLQVCACIAPLSRPPACQLPTCRLLIALCACLCASPGI